MNTLTQIADHIERLALQVKQYEVADELRFLAQRATECQDGEDIFWLSLGGCLRDLAKAAGVGQELREEIINLALTCINEAHRIGQAYETAA